MKRSAVITILLFINKMFVFLSFFMIEIKCINVSMLLSTFLSLNMLKQNPKWNELIHFQINRQVFEQAYFQFEIVQWSIKEKVKEKKIVGYFCPRSTDDCALVDGKYDVTLFKSSKLPTDIVPLLQTERMYCPLSQPPPPPSLSFPFFSICTSLSFILHCHRNFLPHFNFILRSYSFPPPFLPLPTSHHTLQCVPPWGNTNHSLSFVLPC